MLVPIFDCERTIVDTFRLLSRETAIKALKAAIAKGGKNRLDLIKLEAYAKKLGFNITPFAECNHMIQNQAQQDELSLLTVRYNEN